MDHMGLRDPLFTDMDFTPADPRFIMVSSELGLTIRRCALFILAAIDTP
jgi:hypothetical protein